MKYSIFGVNILLLLLLFFLPLLGFSQNDAGLDSNSIDYSYSREYEIGGVTISGVRTLDERSLINRTGFVVGEKILFPGDAITNAIKNLWDLNLFSDIQIYISKTIGEVVFLEIRLQELPRLTKFTLNGLKKSESEDIRERISLVRGTPYNEFVKKNIQNQIKDYFAEKGYLKTDVDVYTKPDSILENNVIVYINVDKNFKVKVNDITFYGVEGVSESKLKKAMKETKVKPRFDPLGKNEEKKFTKESLRPSAIVNSLSNISYASARDFIGDRFRFNIFAGSKFQEKEYRNDKDLILNYYNSLGYRDAEIIADTIYYADEKSINIDLYVNEGNPYYFRNINWQGNTKYSDGKLDTILGIKKGDLYNQDLLNERLQFDQNGQDITSLYMDDGYLFFNISPVEVLVEDDSIDLEVRIYEGPQAVVRNVKIFGNTKTNEHVVRRELRTKPGDKFSRTDLIRSQREIANLGYFDPEQIGVVPIPNPTDGTVDLEYTVVEKPSDQLELSAGWGGRGRGVVGSVGVSFNNFSVKNMFRKGEWKPLPTGDGQRLSFRVNTNGKFFQSYNISFTEPWLGGKKPNSFTFAMFKSLFSNGEKKSSETRESFVTNGISFSYGIRLKWPDDYFTLLSTLSFQNFNLTNWTQQNFVVTDGNVYNVSVTETLARSSIDNPLYPRTGSLLSLSLQLTPPYSLFNNKDYSSSELTNNERFKWIEYHKWRFTADWYTPLIGKLVLKASAKFGFIGAYNRDLGVSPFEQFQLGGDGLSNFTYYGTDILALRGYEVFVDENGQTRNDPIFNKFTLELRYPLSLNPSSTIYAMLFAEGGNTWDTFSDYNPFDMKRAVGVGIRAFLPMFGLLGLDYGIRFDERFPGENQDTNGVFDYILQNGRFSIILGFEPE